MGVPKIFKKLRHVNWTRPEDIKIDDTQLKGIVKVRVIPPKDLLHPVLPIHIDGMMLFTLCGKCARKGTEGFTYKKNMMDCPHTDEERSWILEYTTCELEEALRSGYKVDRLYR